MMWSRPRLHPNKTTMYRYRLLINNNKVNNITIQEKTDSNNNTSEFSCIPAIKVPLGGSATASQSSCFRIYVPSKWGGKLEVSSTGAPPQGLKAADNSDYVSGIEFRDDKHGWFTLYVPAAGPVTVDNSFAESGLADTVPWNFWYFPWLSAQSGLHLYDSPGAYTHFDAKFALGTTSFDWETANHKTAPPDPGWCGHCWGSSLASIILQQPVATGAFTEDELEGFAGEFFDNKGTYRLTSHPALPAFPGVTANELPLEIPTTADTDLSDPYVDRFHTALRSMLRTDRIPVQADLRQETGTGPREVWNQGCYYYKSEMKEEPGAKGDDDTEKILQIHHTTTFRCNEDFLDSHGVSVSDPAHSTWRREQQSEYILIYKDDGDIKPKGNLAGMKQNWLTMKLTYAQDAPLPTPTDIYVPSAMSDVRPFAATQFKNDSTILGRNPSLTGARLFSLGLSKKPGF